MSEVLSEVVKEIVQKKRMVTGIKCDICGKVVPIKKDNDSRYFRVVTGHNDWGNDSCDSVESKDICPECIADFTSKYLQNVQGTEYINIDTEYATGYMRTEED